MADPKRVLEETYNTIAKFLSLPQKGRTLKQWEKVGQKKRRLQFEPTYGQHDPLEPMMEYLGGERDLELRQKYGLASDDPGQLAAVLAAYRHEGKRRP